MPRVLQTVGADGDLATNTFHAPNGKTVVDGVIEDYCACVDLMSTDLSEEHGLALWISLMRHGFAAWWRRHGVFTDNPHFHIVWPGCAIGDAEGKANGKAVKAQIRSYIEGGSGLLGVAAEPFLAQHQTEQMKQQVKLLFLANNRPPGAALNAMVQCLEMEPGWEQDLCGAEDCSLCGAR